MRSFQEEYEKSYKANDGYSQGNIAKMIREVERYREWLRPRDEIQGNEKRK